jgi:hypothetical protein
MQALFQPSIEWPEGSAIRVRTIDNRELILHVAILKHRWPLFADDPSAALDLARSVTGEELTAILLYIYSDLPVKRSIVDTFERFRLPHPQSLSQSTFVADMRALIQDRDSTDFSLESAEGIEVFVHRAVLVARSRYFRSLFLSKSEESVRGVWRCSKPIQLQSLQFFVEYLYTGQIASPVTLQLIPLCWLVKYLRLTYEREVENIVISSLSRELNEENESVLSVAATEWRAKCVLDVLNKYSASGR